MREIELNTNVKIMKAGKKNLVEWKLLETRETTFLSRSP